MHPFIRSPNRAAVVYDNVSAICCDIRYTTEKQFTQLRISYVARSNRDQVKMADSERSTKAVGGLEEEGRSPTLNDQSPRNTSLDRVTKPLHEQSPLLSPSATDNADDEGLMTDRGVLDEDPQDEDEFQETKGLGYMILLTICLGGLQLAWSVELSNGTPYLLSLGLSKSIMALVWIAGPLSGTLVQPYVGMMSDNCRSSWGKRTPFMVAGSVATTVALLALAWVREIVGGFLGLFGADRESDGVKYTIIIVAVIFVYVLDFAINTGTSDELPAICTVTDVH